MLKYHRFVWDNFAKRSNGLYIFGRGLDSFEIVKQMAINCSMKREMVFIFGLDETEKHRIIWECANAGVQFLPKDIEKSISKPQREQFYKSNLVYFHNPGILAKDFLTDLIDPKNIAGLIIANCETVHKDAGLQLCASQFRSLNPKGFVRCFTERVYHVSDLKGTADKLCVNFILLFPRFEANVKESISECDVQIREISLRNNETKEGEFSPIISRNLTKVYDLLEALHSAFIGEHGYELGVDVDTSLTLHKRTLENRATTEDKVRVFESLMFLRRAFFVLLHESPSVFYEFLQAHHPSAYSRPLWCGYPQVNPLYTAASALIEDAIPAPKLQWIIHLITELPKDKKILILAEGTGTVAMIGGFLSGFVPRTDGNNIEITMQEVEGDDEVLIDPTVYGVMTPPMVMLQELHAQADVLDQYKPDFVIFWDVSLLALRRLEVFNSRSEKSVSACLLCYEEAKELAIMQNTTDHETDTFVRCVQTLRTLNITPKETFPAATREIIVDEREFRAGLPLGLLQAGFKVTPALITTGDYILAEDIVVERKAYPDLVGSLKSGRLVQQIQRMNTFYPKSMLLLEFSDTEFRSVSAKNSNPFVMLKLAIIMFHFPHLRIIWARNNTEAAKTLMLLSKGTKESTVTQAMAMGGTTEVAKTDSKAMKFLTSISFLTEDHITKITEHCKTLRDLAKMTRDELMSLLGASIGLKLYMFLHLPLKQPK